MNAVVCIMGAMCHHKVISFPNVDQLKARTPVIIQVYFVANKTSKKPFSGNRGHNPEAF